MGRVICGWAEKEEEEQATLKWVKLEKESSPRLGGHLGLQKGRERAAQFGSKVMGSELFAHAGQSHWRRSPMGG